MAQLSELEAIRLNRMEQRRKEREALEGKKDKGKEKFLQTLGKAKSQN